MGNRWTRLLMSTMGLLKRRSDTIKLFQTKFAFIPSYRPIDLNCKIDISSQLLHQVHFHP